MQLGIFAKTFAGTSPDVVLRQVKAAGFDVAQYNMACSGLPAMPDAIGQDDVEAVRKAVEVQGVTIDALSATYNMIHPNTDKRKTGHHRFTVIAKAASEMGMSLVTLCTGTRDPDDQWRHHRENSSAEAWRDLIASMNIALGVAEKFDVNLGIEPELANVVSNAAKAKRLIDELKSNRIKIILDAANLFEVATLPEQRHIVSEAIDLLAPHIAMAHAKDRDDKGAFVAAGRGVLDYPHLIQCLRDIGFSGPLVTHGLTAEEAPSVSAFLKSALSA